MFNKLFKSFIAVAMVLGSALGFVACNETDEPTTAEPKVELSVSTLNFSKLEGSQSVDIKSNSEWSVEVEESDDWVTVTPMSGSKNGKITISIPENSTGKVRTAIVKVYAMHKTYGKYGHEKLTIRQSNTENATVDEVLLYSDDFDGEEATNTYGSGSSWPYIDQFPQFANQEGPAAENVTYSGKGVSVRANSTSDSQYSDYAGSGSNNIFFGSSAYFQVNNITLAAGQTNLKLTFGSEKYTQDGDSTFKNEEFRIYVSKDGNAWAEIKEYTFAGTEGGRWNVATAEFTLNAVPETLYLKFAATVASVYRLDDLKLFTGNGGQVIDLDNIEAPQPVEAKKVTVAEFLAAAEDSTIYELTGEITSVTNTTYGNFYLNDGTAEVLIYGLCSPSGEQKYWAESGAKVGDTITVQTVRTSYNGTPQGKDAIFVSLVPGEGGSQTPEPGEVVKATVAEFLAAAEGNTVYELTGVITNVANADYGNFDLKDETGTVYVYGLYDESGAKVFTSLGLKEGDILTMRGVRTSYNENPQVGNGVYVSHIVGEAPEAPANSATLSFTDKANRTSFTTEQQVWEQNGVKLINDKASSTTNVADYAAPARFYKSSSITVEGEKAMTKIDFACNNASYATALQNSITTGTVTVDGSIVTVTLPSADTSYEIESLSGGQVRMNSLTVYYAE